MNNWLVLDVVFYNCVGVHGGLDVYEDGDSVCACERWQAYKFLVVFLFGWLVFLAYYQLDQPVEKERLGWCIIWHYQMDVACFPLCSVLPVNGKKRSIER